MSEDKIVISGLASEPRKSEWRSGDSNVLRVLPFSKVQSGLRFQGH